jgi:hypothetical protein
MLSWQRRILAQVDQVVSFQFRLEYRPHRQGVFLFQRVLLLREQVVPLIFLPEAVRAMLPAVSLSKLVVEARLVAESLSVVVLDSTVAQLLSLRAQETLGTEVRFK